MKIFNLTQYALIKANKYIDANCGGKYNRKEAYNIGGIGVGKLRYKSGIDTIEKLDTEEQFRANLETFRGGLGIYVRSLSFNYILAIPFSEIMNVSLVKKVDTIKEGGFSWTKKLMGLGMPYHYARVMLLEQEIVETNDAFLSIETIEESFVFRLKRLNPQKIEDYFKEGPYSSIFVSDIQWYKYV